MYSARAASSLIEETSMLLHPSRSVGRTPEAGIRHERLATHVLSLGALAAVFSCALGLAAPQSRAAGSEFGAWLQHREPDAERTRATLEAQRSPAPSRKVWVYFTDKAVFDSESLTNRLEEVGAALDARAVERRARGRATVALDFYDLPVSSSYLDAIENAGARVEHVSRWLNAASVHANPATLEAIVELPFVAWIDPVRSARTTPVPEMKPGELRTGSRGGLDYGESYGQLEEIGVVSAHAQGFTGTGVIVAMFDTGFNHQHETFARVLSSGRLLAQHDFVNDDDDTRDEPGDFDGADAHGTATWSIVAGYTPSELIGVAFDASFILCKTEDVTSETPVEEDNWVAAAEWAEGLGADVFSTSLTYNDWYTYEDMDGNTAPITIGSDIAASRNVVVCTAAGNQGASDWYYIAAPGDGDSVVTVGAVDELNVPAAFSSHGPTFDGRTKPEVVARGISVRCVYDMFGTGEKNVYGTASGTSMSTPLVAGSAALLIDAFPAFSGMGVRQRLMDTADNADDPNNDIGWGRIDLEAAMQTADAPEAAGRASLVVHAVPNPVRTGQSIELRLPASVRPGATEIRIHAADGTLVRRIAPDEIPSSSDDGIRSFSWNGRDGSGRTVPSGMYFATASQGSWSATAKIVIRG